jgi:hypothetical protein
VEKVKKVKSICGACKSRFFEQIFFMLFDALLTVVFEDLFLLFFTRAVTPNLLRFCFI